MKRRANTTADLQRARGRLDAEWHAQLVSNQPDWMLLVQVHFSLVALERRLRLRGSRP